MIRLLIASLFLCLSLNAYALRLPTNSPVPGGIAVLEVGKITDPSKPPEVHYRDSRVMVLPNAQNWVALVGIPLSAKLGAHTIHVKIDGKDHAQKFKVHDKKYETQYLTVKNKRKVNPTATDMVRIRKEKVRIQSALKHWSQRDDVNIEFEVPVTGIISSTYGLRRFFNKQPRHPHSGLDIAVPKGTPIKAPAPGVVVETGHFFFNGNPVFVDHGQGLVTMYCHMDRIDVKPGQAINTGDILGVVGMTGRVTGPHLHWGVSLNDAMVDPNLLIKQGGATASK